LVGAKLPGLHLFKLIFPDDYNAPIDPIKRGTPTAEMHSPMSRLWVVVDSHML
jgi:hypothetical protein